MNPPEATVEPSPAEVISQSEIEALLKEIGAGEGSAGETAADGTPDFPTKVSSSAHRYKDIAYFSANDLRKLRLRHEELISRAGVQLASSLRLECSLQMSKLETQPLRAFLEGVGDPTHLSIFRFAPLKGMCFLEVPPRLGLCFVDRLLGGKAAKPPENRNFSEIEQRLVSRVVELLLSEFCSYWSAFLDLRPVILGHESSGRFVQHRPAGTVMLVVGISSSINGEMVDEMQVAMPHHTLEPLLARLNALKEQEKEVEPGPGAALEWHEAFEEIPIPVSVTFPKLQLSTRWLAGLKPGDFLPLGQNAGSGLQIRLGGRTKFSGELGVAGEHWAARIVSASGKHQP